MANDPEAKSSTISLESLRDYILKLYLVGGPPLVLTGIGAFLLTTGGGGGRALIAGTSLCLFGIVTWAGSLYVTSIKWKTEMQIVAAQDAEIVKAVCTIVANQKSDVVPEKVDALIAAVSKLGVHELVARNTDRKSVV